MRRYSGAPTKSQVVTSTPSYSLAWMFFDLEHSCTTAHALCWLGSPLARADHLALLQKVEWWGAHPLI
jgi:hypothetical protein